MKKFLTLCLVLIGFTIANASNIRITATVNGLTYDTIWFGNTFGKKSFPTIFFLKKSPPSTYEIEINEALPSGIYTIIFKRNSESKYSQIPIIITEKERVFSFVCDEKDVYGSIALNGSPESTLYYAYRMKHAGLNDKLGDAVDAWRLDPAELNAQKMLEAEQNLIQYQSDFLRNNANTTLVTLLQKNIFKIPQSQGTIAQQIKARDEFFIHEFLNQYNFNDAEFWKTPLSIDLLDYYTFKSFDDKPDNALMRTKAMLAKLNSFERGYQYYFNYMCNSFSKMSKHDYDQVFVYLYKEYIEKGKATWLSQEEVIKYKRDAENIERLMVGKTAPDLQLYKRDNTPFKLSDNASTLNLLVFWSPDCSHCKKELPIIKKLFGEFKDQGLNVTTVCAKKTEFLPTCYEFEDKTQFPAEWNVLYDGSFKSRMVSLYDLSSFPRLFILDKDEKILFRRRGEVPEAELRTTIQKLMGGIH